MSVIIPANAQIYFGYIFTVIAFDPIEIQDPVENFFNLEQSEDFELEDNFVQLGYESAYFLSNLGSLLLIWSIQIFVIPLLVIIMFITVCGKKVSQWAKRKLNQIFCNSILTLIDVSFLMIFMMALINVQQYQMGIVEQNISYWLSVACLTGCAIEMVAVPLFLWRNYDVLDSERVRGRCGYIYQKLNYRVRGAKALLSPIFYQCRLIVLVFAVLYYSDNILVQLQLIQYSSFSLLAMLGYFRPLGGQIDTLHSIFDEIVILFTMDLLLFSSDPTLAPEKRIELGWGMMALLTFSIIWGQGVLLVGNCLKAKQFLKLKFLKRK